MTRYIGVAEYIWPAEQVTGIDTTTLVKASRVDLADSALHAPQPASATTTTTLPPTSTTRPPCSPAGWLGTTHSLMATNAAAWATLLMFVDFNSGHWTPDPPDTDETVNAISTVAARDVDEAWFAGWLRERVQFSVDTAA